MSRSGEERPAPMSRSRRPWWRFPVVVVLGMAGAGVLIGGIWVLLAPAVHGAVALNKAGRRLHVFVGNEADNFFVSAVIMAGLLMAVGVVSAVLMWQFRERRGPMTLTALTVGGVAAGSAACAVGAVLARVRYGAVDIAAAPVSPENRVYYVVDAPAVFFGHSLLQVLATLLVPAGLAALSYATLAAVSAYDDLGVDRLAPRMAA